MSFYLECMPGYSGLKCSYLCPYPSYGVHCQKTCDCSKDECDMSVGCLQTTTGTSNLLIFYQLLNKADVLQLSFNTVFLWFL